MRSRKENLEKVNVTILGDSTIDNKVWISPGTHGNSILDHLHLVNAVKKMRGLFGHPELSVVENLKALLPTHTINDYTNDGFTTHDCLHGAFKDKVFLSNFPGMFPHEEFQPLEAAKEDIKKSQYIVLSIGGNNFREFLQQVPRDSVKRQEYIRENYERVIDKLQSEYLEIVNKLRSLNQDAQIILITQYYPSAHQDNYEIYQIMSAVGEALGIGHDPMDVIHEIVKGIYSSVLKKIPTANVVVADLTSSLNPYDHENHVSQIEPSGIGGKKIAQMLKYIINKGHTSGVVYRFLPKFFTNTNNNQSRDEFTEKSSFDNWVPKHPNEFIDQANNDLNSLLSKIIKIRNQYKLSDPVYKACSRICNAVFVLRKKLADPKEISELKTCLMLVEGVLKDKNNQQMLANLESSTSNTIKKTGIWKNFTHALMYFISVTDPNELSKNKIDQALSNFKDEIRKAKSNEVLHYDAWGTNNFSINYGEFTTALDKLRHTVETNIRKYTYWNIKPIFVYDKMLKNKKEINKHLRIANETVNLIQGLQFKVESQQEDLNKIASYVKNCKLHLQDNSRLTNFAKAVTAVATTAATAVLGTALGTILGIVVSPIFLGYVGSTRFSSTRGKVAGAFLGTLVGILTSPIGLVITMFGGTGVGTYKGNEWGKELTGIPEHESVTRFLSFKPSTLQSAVNEIAQQAKEKISPAKPKPVGKLHRFFNKLSSTNEQAKQAQIPVIRRDLADHRI